MDFFSDSKSEPSPTIAQLLLMSPSELLEMAVPGAKHLKPRIPEVVYEHYRELQMLELTCIHCGREYKHYGMRSSSRKTCSHLCLRSILLLCRSLSNPEQDMYDYLLELARADGQGWEE